MGGPGGLGRLGGRAGRACRPMLQATRPPPSKPLRCRHRLAFPSNRALASLPPCILFVAQVYSAMGLDVGCIQHEGVRLYCCVSQSNLLQQEGIFIMPAWQCYTAPRLNAAERTAWEDHNEYFW